VQLVGSNNISIMCEGDVSALSDRSAKRDLLPISDALTKLDLVNGYTFAWVNSESDARSAGVIAQEFAQVLPEVVTTDPVTGKMHVSYGNISALLIQGIKEVAHKTFAMTLCTSFDDESFEFALPDRKSLVGSESAAPWSLASISAASPDAGKAYADVVDGARLVGRAATPGKYSVVVFC